MYLIGIFGKIGAGKSSLVNNLKRFIDAEFLSADEENKALLSDINYLTSLKAHFPDCFDEDKFNKEKLKQLIFSDKEQNEILRKISHYQIQNRLQTKIERSNKKVIFVEISVFVDNFLDFDEKWLIKANKNKQIKRLKNRDKITNELAESRIDFQEIPTDDYFDEIIVNDGNLAELNNKAKSLVDRLKLSLKLND